MVVAARPLNRGDVVNEADVVLLPISDATRKIAAIRGGGVLHLMSEVVGLEVTRSMAPNQPFDARLLRRPLLVRRGEVIQVTARAAGVTIRTSARAVEEGSHGDLIMLQSEDNRQKYLARVTGLQQAEVYASGPVVHDRPAPEAADDRTKNGRDKKLRR